MPNVGGDVLFSFQVSVFFFMEDLFFKRMKGKTAFLNPIDQITARVAFVFFFVV